MCVCGRASVCIERGEREMGRDGGRERERERERGREQAQATLNNNHHSTANEQPVVFISYKLCVSLHIDDFTFIAHAQRRHLDSL